MNDWDARHYREHTGFVSELGLPLVDLLEPRPGESILDLGCGDGVLAATLMDMGCEVVGMPSFTADSTRCSAMPPCTGCIPWNRWFGA